jgi:hypothetical protein
VLGPAVVGVPVGVGGVAVGAAGVGVVGTAVADVDGPDGAADGGSGSHDSPPDVVAALATVVLAARARLTPENPVSRTLPAISVTVAGRACPKRMKRPTQSSFVAVCHSLDTKRQKAPVALLPRVNRAYHCGDRNRREDFDGGRSRRGRRGCRKVNLRIRNVARKMLVVTLPVRSVLLPGP